MMSDPFLRPSDGSVDVRVRACKPSTDHTRTSERLASAFQMLVPEPSRQTYSTSASAQSFLKVPPSQPVTTSSSVTKRQSMWKLSFWKSTGDTAVCTRSDSPSARSNSTPGPAWGLNPTSPAAPQLQPPPVPCICSRRCGIGSEGIPNFRRCCNRGVGRGRQVRGMVGHWREVQARQHPAIGETRCRAPIRRGAHLRGTATRVCARFRPLPPQPLPHPSRRARTGTTLRSLPSPLPRAFSVMTGVPWELGCAPPELHQKEMDIFGVPQQQQRDTSVRGAGRVSSLRRASGRRVRSDQLTSAFSTCRSGRMRRRARGIWRSRVRERGRGREMGWGSLGTQGADQRTRQDALYNQAVRRPAVPHWNTVYPVSSFPYVPDPSLHVLGFVVHRMVIKIEPTLCSHTHTRKHACFIGSSFPTSWCRHIRPPPFFSCLIQSIRTTFTARKRCCTIVQWLCLLPHPSFTVIARVVDARYSQNIVHLPTVLPFNPLCSQAFPLRLPPVHETPLDPHCDLCTSPVSS